MLRLPLILTLLVLSGCDGGGDATPDAGPTPVDQCTNPSDIGIITGLAEMTDGGIPDGGVPDGGPYPVSFSRALGEFMEATCTGMGQECLDEIFAESGVDTCLEQCFMGTAADGLSLGCAGCYVELIECGAANCATLCFGGTTPDCEACVIAACNPRLGACTGLPVPSLP